MNYLQSMTKKIVKQKKQFNPILPPISKEVLDGLPFGAYIIGKDGIIEYFNRAMMKMAGEKYVNKIIGLNALKLPTYKKAGLTRHFREGLRGKPFRVEFVKYTSYTGKKTTFRHYDGIPVKDEKGHTQKLLCIVEDITEREKDKEALKESEEKFRILMEASPFSIQGYGTDGTVNHWNKASEKVYGYTAEEAIGKNLGKLIIPSDIKLLFKKALQIGKKAEKSGEFMPAGEVSLLRKDGSFVDVFSTHMVVKTEDGEPEMFCIDVDLSERKKMEEELRKLKLGIERSDQAIFTTDKKGTITYVNPTFEKLYGYKSKYALGRHRRLINSRKQTKRFYDIFWKELLKGKAMNVELITKSKNGLHVNVMESVNPIANKKNEIIGFLSIQTNITENKKVQEKLIEAEEKYRDIVENSPAMVHSVDKNGRIVFANQKECKALGYTLEELTGMHIKKIYSAKLWQDVQKGFEQLQKKGSLFVGDGEMVKKNGEIIDVEIDSIAIYNRKRKFMHTRSIIRDVTERKKAEEESNRQKKRFQVLYESSRDAIMILEPPTWAFTSGNPSTVKMFACKNEEDFVTYPPWKLSPPKQPDGQVSGDKAKTMIMKAMKEGSSFFEWTHRRKTGEDFPATVLLTRMTVSDMTYLQATVRDITLQKEAQKALKKAHDELERRVEERTAELQKAKDELQGKVQDLEKFSNLTVGRELRMIELKKKIKELERKLTDKK